MGSPSTNFLTGVFDGKAVNVPYKDGSIAVKLNKDMVAELKDYKDKEVVVGIRPEFMHLKSEYKDDGEVATVKLAFKDSELVGHESIVYFDVNGSRLSAKASSDAEIEAGKDYEFVIELKKIHVFDKETTKTII
ncbi:MAG: TOBE domain-containing protein [Bacilli bacterium]|nr:TOBE domain-containing protein [Bacilli bacterium]